MSGTLVEAQYRITELEDRGRRQTIAMAVTLVSLIDLRDRYTGSHSSRVANYSRDIAVQLGLTDTETDSIVLAASLHDIGKIGVPDHVLLKPGKLTEKFDWIKQHPEYGWMALRNASRFANHCGSGFVRRSDDGSPVPPRTRPARRARRDHAELGNAVRSCGRRRIRPIDAVPVAAGFMPAPLKQCGRRWGRRPAISLCAGCFYLHP